MDKPASEASSSITSVLSTIVMWYDQKNIKAKGTHGNEIITKFYKANIISTNKTYKILWQEAE